MKQQEPRYHRGKSRVEITAEFIQIDTIFNGLDDTNVCGYGLRPRLTDKADRQQSVKVAQEQDS